MFIRKGSSWDPGYRYSEVDFHNNTFKIYELIAYCSLKRSSKNHPFPDGPQFVKKYSVIKLSGYLTGRMYIFKIFWCQLINYLAAELTRYYTEKIFLSQQSCGELDP